MFVVNHKINNKNIKNDFSLAFFMIKFALTRKANMINFSGELRKFGHVTDYFETKLRNKDLSMLKDICLYFGPSFYGICHFPWIGRNNYLIRCRLKRFVNYPESMAFDIRKQGTHRLTIKEVLCKNHEEDMVWLAGHEFYHFLRHSRQISGKNTEAQANEFAFKCLSEFKRNLVTSL
jgi:hypothetical protein